MKLRFLSLLTALCLALSLAAPALAADADTRLETIRALGILSGDESGNLNLSSPVTRAEFVKMMTAASTYQDAVGTGQGGLPVHRREERLLGQRLYPAGGGAGVGHRLRGRLLPSRQLHHSGGGLHRPAAAAGL
ncbi:S-layer homology domain-containing protein [Flavonifractor sp. An10]|uniref:S-layer homology domain-containing protein n=1 Tax=Flavonifractor sp. An10 TaxID=1965537 RepID=UPI001140BBBB|nr:S-layer homology domain-containing protein [Flavonifractor sp. An10]